MLVKFIVRFNFIIGVILLLDVTGVYGTGLIWPQWK